MVSEVPCRCAGCAGSSCRRAELAAHGLSGSLEHEQRLPQTEPRAPQPWAPHHHKALNQSLGMDAPLRLQREHVACNVKVPRRGPWQGRTDPPLQPWALDVAAPALGVAAPASALDVENTN